MALSVGFVDMVIFRMSAGNDHSVGHYQHDQHDQHVGHAVLLISSNYLSRCCLTHKMALAKTFPLTFCKSRKETVS